MGREAGGPEVDVGADAHELGVGVERIGSGTTGASGGDDRRRACSGAGTATGMRTGEAAGSRRRPRPQGRGEERLIEARGRG